MSQSLLKGSPNLARLTPADFDGMEADVSGKVRYIENIDSDLEQLDPSAAVLPSAGEFDAVGAWMHGKLVPRILRQVVSPGVV